MKPLRDIRPPGVYPSIDEIRGGAIGIADTRIAGFIGLATRGPLDEPRRVASGNELQEGYLARAVEGFFQNGGKICFVVRIAHRPKPGERLGPQHAALAERIVNDGLDRPTLRVTALNEGRWGNAIWVRFAQSTSART